MQQDKAHEDKMEDEPNIGNEDLSGRERARTAQEHYDDGHAEEVHHELPPVKKVSIDKLLPSTLRVRMNVDEGALQGLRESLDQWGLLGLPLVRQTRDGNYDIVDGNRLLEVAKRSGLTELKVLVIEADDPKALQVKLALDANRVGLNPMEFALASVKARELANLSQAEMARHIGMDRQRLHQLEKLAKLREDSQALVASGNLSEAHAHVLMKRLSDPDLLFKAAEAAIKEQVSAADLEEWLGRNGQFLGVKSIDKSAGSGRGQKSSRAKTPAFKAIVKGLASAERTLKRVQPAKIKASARANLIGHLERHIRLCTKVLDKL